MCYDCYCKRCICPVLPYTVRFWYKNKRAKPYPHTVIVCIMKVDNLVLFKTPDYFAIENTKDVSKSVKQGETGFNELLDLFPL